MPIRQLTINGSLHALSSLELLKRDSKFIRIEGEGENNYRDTVKMLIKDGQFFLISGEIELRKNKRIKWKDSNLAEIRFIDRFSRLDGYQIVDHWQTDFTLKSLINLSPESYLRLLLRRGFSLQGGEDNDVIDLTSSLIVKKPGWLSVSGGAGADSIIGTKKNDYLAASSSRDICDSGAGTDLTRNVKDVLTGNDGRDTFYVDNGTHVADVEVGEVIHLFNHDSYDLDELSNKNPSFEYRREKTIVRLGDLELTTNPARFDFSYKFYNDEQEMCRTDSLGTRCDMEWIPDEPEGYSFDVIEVA